eukprot:NODE_568_length_1528_cov_292.899256_g429_i0.p1 GENE.NODE_568_length_1528_cov_292.899256_g429_i0~~NODE_568_length_1528_cov_292.899256_g429_i0.p1  ORF type:complete len:495 (+),score=127.94 NODE_568_length_1528_cov_292.899256_g429_i0:60-1487(+)
MNILKRFARIPTATGLTIKSLQNAKRTNDVIERVRDAKAPFVYFTYDQSKSRLTWHPIQAWAADDLPLTREQYQEYLVGLRDLQSLLPLAGAAALGPVGVVVAGWFSEFGDLPSGFSEKTNVYEKKLEWYQEHGNEIRLKMGPLLQARMKKLVRGYGDMEDATFNDSIIESYKETFYSHYTGKVRDVRKAFQLRDFNQNPITLLLTNKDPIELTPELEAQLAAIEPSLKGKSEEARNAALRPILIDAYKAQELRGGPSNNKIPALRLVPDYLLFDDAGDSPQIPENWVPVEELALTGDRVFIPNEVNTAMEEWDRQLAANANEFLCIPWRFAWKPWNQRRFVTWYEQMLQDDALIRRDGGVSKLSDLELKVALLDRAVMRVEEVLTRGDMEARYTEVSWLMSQRVQPWVLIAWQTAFFRTTYSPEDDLPLPTILPPLNRSPVDVDIQNPLVIEKPEQPLPFVHPALYPDALRKLV